MGKNLKKLVSYYKPYLGTFLLDMFFAVVASAIALVVPLIVRYITSEVIYLETGAKERIIHLGLILVGLVVIQFFSNYYITNIPTKPYFFIELQNPFLRSYYRLAAIRFAT